MKIIRILAALALTLALASPVRAAQDTITTPGGNTYPVLCPGGFCPLFGAMILGGPGSSTGTPSYFGQANGDPCSTVAHSYTPINISTAGNTKIVTGTSAKKTYICHFREFTAGANNVALVEGTGTACATNTAGIDGGPTAATGWNLAANQGHVDGSGQNAIAATATAANDVCLITSAAVQLSGVVVWVQQ